MKKIIMLFAIITSRAIVLSAHIDFEHLSEKDIYIHEDVVKQKLSPNDYEIGTIDSMEDYEQQICDVAQNPKISSVQARIIALFDSVVGSLLVKMIVMKEIARYYLTELKTAISSWTKTSQGE